MEVVAVTETSKTYPCRVDISGHEVELRKMSRADRDELAEWASALPPDDLLFMRRDITQVSEIDAWADDIERGIVETVLASIDGRLAGYATMHRSPLRWSRHVAELRVVVAPHVRQIGLGRALTQEIFSIAIESGVQKLVARMTLDQAGARRSFEVLGFRTEAVLRGHVLDRHDNKHDILLMSQDVEEFRRLLETHGADSR